MDRHEIAHAADHAASSNGHRQGCTPPDGDLDALADLFLGPSEPAATSEGEQPRREQSAPGRPRVEAVVLGHLPVSASAWPGQYARRCAEELGEPVAVIRLSGGSLAVDLIGTGRPGQRISGETEAIGYVRSVAGLVILRVDEPTEAALAGLASLDSLCLLTGADDAAIVACYRKLKGLAAAAGDRTLPAVHLTIMGADREKAQLAHERVSRAASAFLEAELLEPVLIDRIGPTGSTVLHQGPTELTLEELGELLALGGDAVYRDEPVVGSVATVTPGPEPLVPPAVRIVSPVPPTKPGPAATAIGSLPREANDRLVALVEGVSAIESRCPTAERVELGVDEDGRLHLVAAVLSSQPALACEDPLGDLLRAAAWARTNAALLSRAEPAISDCAALLHLVTDVPATATALLGTRVRVHLAATAKPAAFGLVAMPLD